MLLEDQLTGSTAGRGLRAGLAGVGAAHKAYLAQAMEAAGRTGDAERLFAEAAADQQRAAAVAPDVPSLAQGGLTPEYVRAKLGEGLGSTLPTIAGAVAGRTFLGRGGALLGGVGTALPAEGGETVQALRADPAAMANTNPTDRVLIATARGGANALLEAAVPAALAGRAGRVVPGVLKSPGAAVGHVAKVAGEAALGEGLTEAAQEGTGILAEQYANPLRDGSGDAQRLLEAGVGGAIAGGGLGAAGGAVDLSAAGVAPAAQRVRGLFKNPDSAALAGGDEVPLDVARKGVDAVSQYLQDMDAKVRPAVERAMQRVLGDAKATPEQKQQAAETLANLDDPDVLEEGRRTVSARAAGERFGRKVREVGEWMSKRVKGGADKFSLQNTDADRIIFGHMQHYLDPEVVDDVETSNKLYSYLKAYFDKDNGLDGRLPDPIIDLLGGERQADKALKNLHGLFVRAGVADPDQAYNAKTHIDDVLKRQRAVGKILATTLDVKWGDASSVDLPEVTTRLEALFNKPQEKWSAADREDLKELFGNNEEKAVAALSAQFMDSALSSKTNPEAEMEGYDDVAAEDFGSDVPDSQFSRLLDESGPNREFHPSGVDQHDRPTFWQVDHPDEKTRTEIRARYAKERQRAEAKGGTVHELNPAQYAEFAGTTLADVAKMLGVSPRAYKNKAMLRSMLESRPERMLMSETPQINEDPIDFNEADVEKLVAHGRSTRTTTRSASDTRPFDPQDVVYQDKNVRKFANDEGRHGRFYVKLKVRETVDPETGEVKREPGKLKPGPTPISAQELISFVQKTKGEAFDERTAELIGDQKLRALFASGFSSLVSSGYIEPEIAVKRGDKFQKLNPATFPIFRRKSGEGYIETYLGVAGKEEKRNYSAKDLKDEKRTASKRLPSAERREEERVREDAAYLGARVMNMESNQGQQHRAEETVIDGDTYETIDRDNQGRRFGKRERIEDFAREGDEIIREGKYWAIKRRTGFNTKTTIADAATAETEEMAEQERARAEREVRVFDEWGNPNTPRGPLRAKDEALMWAREADSIEQQLKSASKALRPTLEKRLRNAEEKMARAQAVAEKLAVAANPPASVRRVKGEYYGPDATQDGAETEASVSSEFPALSTLGTPLSRKQAALWARAEMVAAMTQDGDVLARMADLIDSSESKEDLAEAEGVLGQYEREKGLKYSMQKPSGKAVDPQTQQEVKDYVEKVLGPKMQVQFKTALPKGAAGMFSAPDLIRIAMSAIDPKSIAFHEALHGLFTRLDKPTQALLADVANSPQVMSRLRKLLANEPAALAQLSDAEERAAYMYQFWAAKQLVVGGKAETLFGKIKAFLRKIVGVLSQDEHAAKILEAFHDGRFAEPSTVHKVLAEINAGNQRIENVKTFLKPVTSRVYDLIATSEGLLRDAKNPELTEIADLFNGQSGATVGYFPAFAQASAKYLNTFEQATRGASKEDMAAALKALQKEDGTAPAGAEAAKIYRSVRGLLDEMLPYVAKAGVPIRERKNYFPRVWDVKELLARGDEFKARLLSEHKAELAGIARAVNQGEAKKAKTLGKNYVAPPPISAEGVATKILSSLVSNHGVAIEEHGLSANEDAPSYSPFMQSVNSRQLTFLKNEAFSDFFNNDLVNVVSSYVVQGTKRAEWTRRFGERGQFLDQLFERGTTEMSSGDSARVARAIMAMSGTLGADISPALRKASGVAMVYQNLRLLPLSLFSSLIDPLGLVVRGGTLKEAGDAFLRGMREIMKGRTDDEQQRVAEMLGTVDASSFLDALGNMYSSVYMTGWQKKVNEAIFKFNGMEAWNRAMRTSATQAAMSFIKRHVQAPNEHSERYLGELGLKAADVQIHNGGLDLMNPKVQAAVMRWVDGAVLRPNAAQRPAWASDPHWAVFFHMKQFMYSFQKTILERTWTELQHGNVAPIATLAFGYVPLMIAADMAKGVIQGFGDEPDARKGWGPSDYIVNGVQRAGLLGVGQMAVDAAAFGPATLGGPSVEQAVDAAVDPVGRTALHALPAQGLFK